MTLNRFESEQWLDRPLSEVWSFFSNETNLERITPPWLNFKVVNKSTDALGEGTEISYRLKLRGIPVGWTSRIDSWDPPNRFVDRQLKGPYALWHHTHDFEAFGARTRMRDRVQYKLHFGFLGQLFKPWVERDIARIFKYRSEVIADIFASNTG